MKTSRNDPCPCGSGRKYKLCCARQLAAVTRGIASGATTTPALDAPDPDEQAQLEALFAQGHALETENLARALLSAYPTAGLVWKFLGLSLLLQGKDALPSLRRATELLPYDAQAHAGLGVALRALGHWPEAYASFQRSLILRPNSIDAIAGAADSLRVGGRVTDAMTLYQRALQVNSLAPDVLGHLADCLTALGRFQEALEHYQRAIAIDPRNARLYCNQAHALGHLGQMEMAVTSSQRAIMLDPTLADAHDNLGLALVGLGRFPEAAPSFRQALALDPNHTDALNNLGRCLIELGEPEHTLAIFQRAIALRPNHAPSHRYLGDALLTLRRLDEAVASYRHCLILDLDHAEAHLGLAMALRMLGQVDAAEASVRTALALLPQSPAALTLLGEINGDRGKFLEAGELFERAIKSDPDYADAWSGIANNRRMATDESWLQGTERLLAKQIPLRHQIDLRFARGKYFDDIREFGRAFAEYREANELTKKYGWRYDGKETEARIDRIIREYARPPLNADLDSVRSSELPVLVVGMPRSGTSLLEQILASHPSVYGAGELLFWGQAATGLECTRGNASGQATAGLGLAYLQTLSSHSATAERIIDKMPSNFLHLGLIHGALPRARIIHVQRHPLDTCLSIYFQYFLNTHTYASDLGDLAHFYRQYLRIMAHWHRLLPPSALLDVPYEGIVDDLEGWSRRIVEFLGLGWDPKCLQFHETDRVVVTVSKWQVRQKISATRVNRWKDYEKFLGPLQELTELTAGAH